MFFRKSYFCVRRVPNLTVKIDYFQAKAGKELRKQFPEPTSVGEVDVRNFAFSSTANALQARNYLKYFQRRSTSVIYYLINC